MRNLLFALTTEQIRNRTKTVTRRKGTWWASVLEPGDLLCAVEKSQGIAKGGLVRLCVIRVVAVGYSLLDPPAWQRARGWARDMEPTREGFPHLTWEQFVSMFCQHMRCTPDQTVTRIEFEYVRQTSACDGCTTGDPAVDNPFHEHGLCPCGCHGEEAFR